MIKPIHLLLLLCSWKTLAIAQETKGLEIALISEVKSIKAGESFTVGLHLKHHKGFHSYWKNPGVVGLPTSIKWDLPKGFTAGEIQWPYPELTMMAIQILLF